MLQLISLQEKHTTLEKNARAGVGVGVNGRCGGFTYGSLSFLVSLSYESGQRFSSLPGDGIF